MKKSVFGLVAVIALAYVPVAEAKVAVVSFENVLAKTRVGQRISKSIARYFKGKQVRINRMKQNLQKQEKQIVTAFKRLQASVSILRKASFQAKKHALEQRYRQLIMKGQRLMQQVQRENAKLQKKRYEMLKPLKQTFLSTVGKLARARGYSAVIERGAVYFHVAGVDITPVVVKEINQITK